METPREQIVAEIRRLAKDQVKPPGQEAFQRATGIREHDWRGVHWTKWSDALAEAGFEANVFSLRFKTSDVLLKIVEACRHFSRVPVKSEMMIYRRGDSTFPSKGAIAGHFPTRTVLIEALREYSEQNPGHADITAMLPPASVPSRVIPKSKPPEGHVYLLKSGIYYKIGRSEELERRVKEVRVTMPDTLTLVHAINTDDPAGIEAYWHRRFADKRANGEWFRLTPGDIAAFKRRRFQ